MRCAGYAGMLVGSELQLGRRDLDSRSFQVLREYVPNAPLLVPAAIQKLARSDTKIGADYRAKRADAGLRGPGAVSVGLFFCGGILTIPDLMTQFLRLIARGGQAQTRAHVETSPVAPGVADVQAPRHGSRRRHPNPETWYRPVDQLHSFQPVWPQVLDLRRRQGWHPLSHRDPSRFH